MLNKSGELVGGFRWYVGFEFSEKLHDEDGIEPFDHCMA